MPVVRLHRQRGTDPSADSPHHGPCLPTPKPGCGHRARGSSCNRVLLRLECEALRGSPCPTAAHIKFPPLSPRPTPPKTNQNFCQLNPPSQLHPTFNNRPF